MSSAGAGSVPMKPRREGWAPGVQVIPRPEGARMVSGPPWPDRDRIITMADVRAVFDGGGPEGPSRTGLHGATLQTPRPSAVLCTLFEEEGAARVVLTRRSSSLRSHTGQVSFPGGRLDEGEEAVTAALREAEEEIGLDPSTIEVIGVLSPLVTISSGAAISPFVGVLPGRPQLRPNPSEVERVFDVALTELTAADVYHEELWPFPGGDRSMYVFDLDGDTVWGATARMLTELLDLIFDLPAPLGEPVVPS